jgi:hypothetical protein
MGRLFDGLVGWRLWGGEGKGGSKLYALLRWPRQCARGHGVEDAADHAAADSAHGVGFVVVVVFGQRWVF